MIDRSIWSAKSGADQTALLGAFKFLGLTDQAGETQQFLKDLVGTAENTDAEKHLLGSLMRQRYDKLFELDLEAATPNQVAEGHRLVRATGLDPSPCRPVLHQGCWPLRGFRCLGGSPRAERQPAQRTGRRQELADEPDGDLSEHQPLSRPRRPVRGELRSERWICRMLVAT